jgi:Bacterial protein of unknown function (DUF961).
MKKYKMRDPDTVFGKLVFLDFEEQVNEAIGFGRNAKKKHIGNKYGLLSDNQDDVTLVLPSFVPKLNLNFMQPVKLVNPVLVAVPEPLGRGNAFLRWEVHADNVVSV